MHPQHRYEEISEFAWHSMHCLLCNSKSAFLGALQNTMLHQLEEEHMPWWPTHSPKVCQLILEACNTLKAQENPNITHVLHDIKDHTGEDLPYDTVCCHFLGKALPPCEAHASQQLLSPEAERVLVDWTIFLSDTSHPLNKWTIWKKAEALCGKKPSKSWICGFLGWNPEIKLGRLSGLDPKHTQAFNKPTICKHFHRLHRLIQKHNIPVENIYNMDEKGCQRGGGCKGSSHKCLIPCRWWPKYMSHSTSLELITIIECVCADSTALLPGFVFSGKEFCPEWFTVEPKIGWVLIFSQAWKRW